MRQLKISRRITNQGSQSLGEYLQEIGKDDLHTSVSLSKQYQNQGLTPGDLTNEENLAQVKAARRHDETIGFKFISYSDWWIRQAFRQMFAEKFRIVCILPDRSGSLNRISKTLYFTP